MSNPPTFYPESMQVDQYMLGSTDALSKFTTVVELLTANKVSKNNAFENRMIDFVSDMFKGTKDINSDSESVWQRYSTGIDSCAKVYGFCVDYLYTETFKVLGGLNRSGNTGLEIEAVDDEAKTSKSKKKVYGGTNTLEKSLDAISTSKFDSFEASDPFFKVISSKFDASTTAGLLLNTLTLNGSLSLILGEDDSILLTEPIDSSAVLSTPFDISLSESDLSDPLCRTFSKFSKKPLLSSKIEAILTDMNNANDLFSSSESEASEAMDLDNLVTEPITPHTQELTLNASSLHERISSLAERDDYNFFNNCKTQEWAGIEYWKKTQGGNVFGDKPLRKKKEVNSIVLDPWKIMKREEVLAPCKRGYPNSLNEASLKKSEESNASLPEDYGFSLFRLTQLFTRPRTYVKFVKDSTAQKNVVVDQQASHVEDESTLFTDQAEPLLVPEPTLAYATTSKTVDIKRLKETIWKTLSTPKNKENLKPSIKNNHFLSILSALPSLLPPAEVSNLSVHSCFITLLHLANEHSLSLKPDGNCDFLITQGR